ncbi:MAG: HAD-IC family P-type ATPase, partial [Firmicutes bacterium]|nr:HAD-IC family P-type ATPase [Bacillota bacterium]
MARKEWHALLMEETAEKLGTDLSGGLSSERAAQRLKEEGPNELKEQKGPTLLQKLLVQLSDFLVVILILSAVVSAVLGEVTDAAVIIAIVALNAILGVVQEAKAEKALEGLKKMASPIARVIRSGHVVEVPASNLVRGDIVLLEAGANVPADLRLVEAVNLKAEEAALTGESVPVDKRANALLDDNTSLGDRANMVFMGTAITYGRGRGIVVEAGMSTQIGKIAGMIQSYSEEKTHLQEKLEHLGKRLGLAVLAVTAVVFAVGLFRAEPLLEMFMTAVSLAVAAIPEGLPAVVTIVLAMGMRR